MKSFIVSGLVLAIILSASGCAEKSSDISEEAKERLIYGDTYDLNTDSSEYAVSENDVLPMSEIVEDIEAADTDNGKEVDSPSYEFDTPILLKSSGTEKEPFVHYRWSQEWFGDSWLCGDGIPLAAAVSGEGTELPEIVYENDFTVWCNDGVSITKINVYSADTELDKLYEYSNVSELEELSIGKYYLGISVTKVGEFIEEADEYETAVYECLYSLEKLS